MLVPEEKRLSQAERAGARRSRTLRGAPILITCNNEPLVVVTALPRARLSDEGLLTTCFTRRSLFVSRSSMFEEGMCGHSHERVRAALLCAATRALKDEWWLRNEYYVIEPMRELTLFVLQKAAGPGDYSHHVTGQPMDSPASSRIMRLR